MSERVWKTELLRVLPAQSYQKKKSVTFEKKCASALFNNMLDRAAHASSARFECAACWLDSQDLALQHRSNRRTKETLALDSLETLRSCRSNL